jgi:hypothetical protein
MNTQALGQTPIGQLFIRMMATIMESRLRYKLFGPTKILQGAGICPGVPDLPRGASHLNVWKLRLSGHAPAVHLVP